MRITKELYDELNERAESCNTTISKVAEARLHNNDSILDKRAVYKAMMKVSVLLEKQESQYKKIDMWYGEMCYPWDFEPVTEWFYHNDTRINNYNKEYII